MAEKTQFYTDIVNSKAFYEVLRPICSFHWSDQEIWHGQPRRGLEDPWQLGCPPKFLTIVQQLHEGQQVQIKHNGNLLDPFPIGNGVKQGCMLAPTLFAIFYSMMLREAMEELTV